MGDARFKVRPKAIYLLQGIKDTIGAQVAKGPNFRNGGIKFNQRNLIKSVVCGDEHAAIWLGLVTRTMLPEKQLFSSCHVLCQHRLLTSISSTF